MKISKYNHALLRDITPLLQEAGEMNTRQLRIALGHKQTYETPLRNRLFRLAEAGVLVAHEISGEYWCRARYWRLAEVEI